MTPGTAYEHHEASAPISIYTIRDDVLVCLADTDEEGIAVTLRTLRADREIGHDSPVGIRDRAAGIWYANPFAGGRSS